MSLPASARPVPISRPPPLPPALAPPVHPPLPNPAPVSPVPAPMGTRGRCGTFPFALVRALSSVTVCPMRSSLVQRCRTFCPSPDSNLPFCSVRPHAAPLGAPAYLGGHSFRSGRPPRPDQSPVRSVDPRRNRPRAACCWSCGTLAHVLANFLRGRGSEGVPSGHRDERALLRRLKRWETVLTVTNAVGRGWELDNCRFGCRGGLPLGPKWRFAGPARGAAY